METSLSDRIIVIEYLFTCTPRVKNLNITTLSKNCKPPSVGTLWHHQIDIGAHQLQKMIVCNTHRTSRIQNNTSVLNGCLLPILSKNQIIFHETKSLASAVTTCYTIWIYLMEICLITIMGHESPFVLFVAHNIRHSSVSSLKK